MQIGEGVEMLALVECTPPKIPMSLRLVSVIHTKSMIQILSRGSEMNFFWPKPANTTSQPDTNQLAPTTNQLISPTSQPDTTNQLIPSDLKHKADAQAY
jgi:hypothetical protein